MRLIVEKKAFFMPLLIIIILLFLGPLIGLDHLSAQSGGQTGQTLGLGGLSGLGGLGLGNMMLGLGYNMGGAGGTLGLVNSLGLGFSTGGYGSIGMLGITNSGMIGGTVYGGSGLYGMYGGLYGMYGGMYGGIYGGMFGMYGGMSGMYGGMSGMYGGMSGMYGGMFGMYGGMFGMYGGMFGMYGGLYGMYGGIYGGLSPYSVLPPTQSYEIRGAQSNIANAMVPFFYGTGGSLYIPPLPYGITLHIDVVGYVYDADVTYIPLEGVTVTTKNSATGYSVKSGYSGRFVIELFPDRYTLVFKKEGYQDTEVENVRVIAGMESLFVYMKKKKTINKEPVLEIPYIEVIAGDEITLDPNALVSDPDGDPLTFSYSGWKPEYWEAGLTYTTTEDDIGPRDVYITFSDGKSPSITKTLVIDICPGYVMVLYEGFNLISYPFENGDPNFSAFDLMEKLGGFPQIDSVSYYDNINDQYITAWYDSNGIPTGNEDFPIRIGQGYIIYANEDITKKVINRYDGEDHDLELYQGINLVGIASRQEGYTSYALLLELEGYYVDSIYRYDPFWGDWETTYWLNGSPAGDLFPILKGEGYHIQIKENN